MVNKKIAEMSEKELKAKISGASNWYASKLKIDIKTGKTTKITADDLLRGRRNVVKPQIGMMFSFAYEAKGDDKLPYWDRFPLAFVIDITEDSFLSLNLHYLPFVFREKLIEYLLTAISDERLDHRSKAKMSYSILKAATQFNIAAPAIKRHLFSQMRSKVIRINPSEWPEVIFLPVQQWVRATNAKVFADSRRMMR